jgi:hypothetical protein
MATIAIDAIAVDNAFLTSRRWRRPPRSCVPLTIESGCFPRPIGSAASGNATADIGSRARNIANLLGQLR